MYYRVVLIYHKYYHDISRQHTFEVSIYEVNFFILYLYKKLEVNRKLLLYITTTMWYSSIIS